MNKTADLSPPADQQIVKGVVLFIAFAAYAPAIDVFGKLATEEIPAAEITFARFLLQTILLAPIVVWRRAFTAPPARDLAMHAARGVLMAIATVFFFAALKHMPIADAISIFFVEPFLLILLGAWLLGEKVGWRRYAACAVGFVGAMIVIQPSYEELGWTAALPLGTALTFAFYMILTRHLAPRSDPFAMQTYAGIAGALFMAVVLWIGEGTGDPTFDPVWPSPWFMWMLLGVGVVATSSHLLIVFASRYAPASVLAPLQYLEIVAATIYGYLIFGDFMSPDKWLGVAIIIGSGLFIFWRERRLGRQTT